MGLDYYASHFFGVAVGGDIPKDTYFERAESGSPDEHGCLIVSLDQWGSGSYAVVLADTYKSVRVKDGPDVLPIPTRPAEGRIFADDSFRVAHSLRALGLEEYIPDIGWHMAIEAW